MTAKKYDHTPVDSIRHADKRANIPTEELRDFVAEEERAPKHVVYPRDPSLDPQLVWKGKDEQDSKDLEVPAVPIYVQEKIHPQALIENLRQTAKAGESEPELTLFDDYDGIDFEELIDFYHHEQNWSNRMILGDSLLVMTSLAEKEALKGQVQMIFMDPPYGIKFRSNWQVSTRKRDVTDGKASDATRQPEQVKAFRDTWELGIHSYLAYMRDRLEAAASLLTETGSVFVQIGDDNVHLVRSVMDEVFGPDNFLGQIAFSKTTGSTTRTVPSVCDYLVWYAKDAQRAKFHKLYQPTTPGGAGAREYKRVELADGTMQPISKFTDAGGSVSLPDGARIFATDSIVSAGGDDSDVSLEWKGATYVLSCKPNRHWKCGAEGIRKLWDAGRLLRQSGLRIYKRYFDDFPYQEISNVWTDTRGEDDPVYVVQTNTKVIQRCVLMTTDPGDLVLDPTCGSGTTAFVAEQWGRRWITIDTSRVAVALARTRLMSARYPYYQLVDSASGARAASAMSGVPVAQRTYGHDVRQGFVYRTAPHITQGGIANNPDITPDLASGEIERLIRRSADTIALVDQPAEDGDQVRVAGPFTVESLSPHRMLEVDERTPRSDLEDNRHADFAATILTNLKKAGIQNSRRQEKINLTSVDFYPGEWVNAVGEYLDADEMVRRIAISIGPEHGTVGSEQVKEAAKEAMRGVGFDLLVVLGFAFDSRAGETAIEISPGPEQAREFAAAEASRQYGKLKVLLARMNPDLAMGDELLKKTGAGNLFMVFGEPDVDVRSEDGQCVVAVKGVDVYDPTTGQVRSDSTDDIACWFIDTNYNGESFFVRHAYFTGAEDPYDKLKKALRAEIDEAVWSTLYSTVSRPFDKPLSGKIAIKVINHYGDEVMKVYEV